MSLIVHPVILCGGIGTRLWPLSTPKTPKQFLALTSDKSLITETAERFSVSHDSSVSFGPMLVVGSAKHQNLLSQHLPNARQILEPFGRNSAPAVAAACIAHKPDDLIIILPADHSIRDVPAFHKAIGSAAQAAQEGAIVTFGIKPTYPSTGYGYIKAAETAELGQAIKVEKFIEKPPLKDAKTYLKSNTYFWNAGIFLFRASTMLEALKLYAPKVLSGTEDAIGRNVGSPVLLDAENFADTPSISIDFAVMEHAKNVETVPVDMDWSDVGGYPALHELLTDDPKSNAISGRVVVRDSSGLYVRSDGPIVSVSGVSNLAIVASGDDVMITPIDDADAIKTLGTEVQTNRDTLGLSEAVIDQARDWLWRAFNMWSRNAWDTVQGGFVEELNMDCTPNRVANRRVVVQARQVFSFARAYKLGWPGKETAHSLVTHGLDYLDQKLRHAEGGWVHIVDPAGKVIDNKRSLYDHAFIILAGAEAYTAFKDQRALSIALESAEFIRESLASEDTGGWYEDLECSLPRRANPHMHLLEASCALYQATQNPDDLTIAKESVSLFESRFFDARDDILVEFFDDDWTPYTRSRGETIFEVGHMYEWASLLQNFESLSGHDTISWRRRLIRRADLQVKVRGDGFASNSERLDGVRVNPNRRLWPQLEMIRAHLLHPGLAPIGAVADMFERITNDYVRSSPDGAWIDEFDDQGRPVSNTVPASVLYHFTTAFTPLID